MPVDRLVRRRRAGRIGGVLAAGALALLAAEPASGQLSAGVDASYNNDVVFGTWGFGGRVGVELPAMGVVSLKLVGAGVWYVPSCAGGTCDWWEAQGMVLVSRPGTAPVAPYLGAGASYHTFEIGQGENREWGLDFLLGTALGVWGPVFPYVEVRYKVMTGSVAANQFVFTLGVGVGA